jgi:predicted alpha/beta superfamily hydrolase
MKKLIIILIILHVVPATAQHPPVMIPGSETRFIRSEIVKGQEYELQILLPGSYSTHSKQYPVVYLMDSQWDFPLVKSIYGQYYYDGFIPELIIVGVTWGGKQPNPDSLRARDYTPTREARLIQSGGADQFLSFMKNELFPFMEKNYRVSKNERVLMGCSLGGLLTMYAMLTHTEMFSGYAAASPAIGWDNNVLYQYEKTFAAKKNNTPVRLYMTVGDVERGRAGFEKMASFLTGNKYEHVQIRSKVLENTGHSGTKSETYTRGLQYIFEKKELPLTEEQLTGFSGTYLLPNGSTIELKKEGNQLCWYYNPQNKIRLLANTATHLYATHEFFNLHFTITNGKTNGFDWVRYGSSQFIKKIN